MRGTEAILDRLYETEGFVSLAELAEAQGLTGPALEHRLAGLAHAGLRIERGDGAVRLLRPVRPVGHLIERGLGTRRSRRSVLCFDVVDSTNDVAAAAARMGKSDGLVVIAETQRHGRGRGERAWLDEPGSSLLMSVALDSSAGPLPNEAVTVAAGLAAAEAIRLVGGVDARLKWPNDVLIDERKVCGVLLERRAAGEAEVLIIGVGVNVSACPPEQAVHRPATHLAAACGRPIERIELARAVLGRLDHWISCIEEGRLDALRTAWLRLCDMLGERITVASGHRRYVGRVLDLDPLEGLVLAGDEGGRVYVPAAGATVLP